MVSFWRLRATSEGRRRAVAAVGIVRALDDEFFGPTADRSEVVALLRGAGVPKGDTLAVARLAGIMGAKQTPSLIPLCHPLSISGVTLDLSVADDAVEISATRRWLSGLPGSAGVSSKVGHSMRRRW